MPRITEVTKILIIMNVIVFVAAEYIFTGSIHQFLVYQMPWTKAFQPVQLIGHMFMHADPTHLLFNMWGLFMFGPPLESKWGAQRFLFYYLFTGFGAVLLYTLVNIMTGSSVGAVGASGAIFGLLAGFGLSYPNQKIMLLFPPIPMKAKYFVLFFAALELYLGMSSHNTGVAHFAHLGGALFGFLLIQYWNKFGSKW